MGKLIFITGDQLSLDAIPLKEADQSADRVVMAEVEEEIRRFPNHKQRVVLFLSAMRHFRQQLEGAGYEVVYQEIGDEGGSPTLIDFLDLQIKDFGPDHIAMTESGRYSMEQEVRQLADLHGVSLSIHNDPHFLCTRQEFSDWAGGRKALVMEYFYRMMRKKYGYLMEGGKPAGGAWNFDKENRGRFGRRGPGLRADPHYTEPDRITLNVIKLVEVHFSDLPGSLDHFHWPVTATEAEKVLAVFIEHHLPEFGTYQDAMWTGEPFLYHSRISAALNLKLLDPRDVIASAIGAYEDGNAPINAVEGFVRQILGWREFIRGVYWHQMPAYRTLNALAANEDLPAFFWTGDTEMHCLREVVGQLLDHAYAHHIQRLMVAGLFTLLYGVEPKQVHEWFMALYVDSVEWVTLPNTIGMSQFADGGIIGTKPYAATGKYIKRMSNYCSGCRFDPDLATGEDACPFTTLYWDFLMRHEEVLSRNRRMAFQMKNISRKNTAEREAISERAQEIRKWFT